MDEQGYRDPLLDAAKKISGWVGSPAKMEFFRKQIRVFYKEHSLWCKANKKYEKKLKQYRKDAKVHLETLPIIKVLNKPRDGKQHSCNEIAQVLNKYGYRTFDGKDWQARIVKSIIESKYKPYREVMKKGWILEQIWLRKYIVRREVKKKPGPGPLAWLSIAHKSSFDSILTSMFGENKDLALPYEPEKSLRADCALLTIIHDRKRTSLRMPRINNDIWSDDEDWADTLWKQIKVWIATKEVQADVELTLGRVKTELDKLPAEIKPEISGGNAGEINKANEKIEPLSEKGNAVKMKSCWYSEDFTTVIWFGKEYRFNKTQSLCIQYLWENGTASEKTIGEHIDSAADNYRLINTFRSKKGKHSAWGKMIVSSGKGIFALKKTTKK